MIRPFHPPGCGLLHLEEHPWCQSSWVSVGVSQPPLLAALRGGGRAFPKRRLRRRWTRVVLLLELDWRSSTKGPSVLLRLLDLHVHPPFRVEKFLWTCILIVSGFFRVISPSLLGWRTYSASTLFGPTLVASPLLSLLALLSLGRLVSRGPPPVTNTVHLPGSRLPLLLVFAGSRSQTPIGPWLLLTLSAFSSVILGLLQFGPQLLDASLHIFVFRFRLLRRPGFSFTLSRGVTIIFPLCISQRLWRSFGKPMNRLQVRVKLPKAEHVPVIDSLILEPRHLLGREHLCAQIPVPVTMDHCWVLAGGRTIFCWCPTQVVYAFILRGGISTVVHPPVVVEVGSREEHCLQDHPAFGPGQDLPDPQQDCPLLIARIIVDL